MLAINKINFGALSQQAMTKTQPLNRLKDDGSVISAPQVGVSPSFGTGSQKPITPVTPVAGGQGQPTSFGGTPLNPIVPQQFATNAGVGLSGTPMGALGENALFVSGGRAGANLNYSA